MLIATLGILCLPYDSSYIYSDSQLSMPLSTRHVKVLFQLKHPLVDVLPRVAFFGITADDPLQRRVVHTPTFSDVPP